MTSPQVNYLEDINILYKKETNNGMISLKFKDFLIYVNVVNYLITELKLELKENDNYGYSWGNNEFSIILKNDLIPMINDIEKEINSLQNESFDSSNWCSEIKKFVEKANLDNKEEFDKLTQDTFDKRNLAQIIQQKKPFYYDRAKCFFIWDNKKYKYERIDETDILNFVNRVSSQNTISQKEKSEIIEAFRQVGREFLPSELDFFHIQFHDKIINLKDGTYFSANPKVQCNAVIPHKLGKSKETPKIDAFLRSLVQNDTEKEHLKEILAISMIPKNIFQVMIFLIGSGANGKSTYSELFRCILGNNNVCSVDLEKLTTSRFEAVKLKGKLLADFGELERGKLVKTYFLKMLVGGELISVEEKGKPATDIENIALPLFNCNELPETQDHSHGFFRRVVLVIFKKQFKVGRSPLLDINEEEYENFCWWAVHKISELIKTQKLTFDMSTDEKKQLYLHLSNPLEKWFNENIDENPEGFEPCYEILNNAEQFCKSQGLSIPSQTTLGNFLRGKEIQRKQRTIKKDDNNSKVYWCYIGVSLRKSKNLTNLTDLTEGSISKLHIENQVETPSEVSEVSENLTTLTTSTGTSKSKLHIENQVETTSESSESSENLTIDLLKDYFSSEKRANKSDLKINLSHKYTFNDAQIEAYLTKLESLGFIFQTKPDFYEVVL